MDPEQKKVIQKAVELNKKNSELKELEKETKALRAELLAEMTQRDWKSIDLPGMMKLTLVEFIKEAVGTEGIARIKTMVTGPDLDTVVKTREFVDKEGIKHLKVILNEAQLVEVLELSPVRYVKVTNREK